MTRKKDNSVDQCDGMSEIDVVSEKVAAPDQDDANSSDDNYHVVVENDEPDDNQPGLFER